MRFPFAVTGCDGNEERPRATVATFDSVCDKSNVNKLVSLEGFLDFPDKFNAKAPTRTSKEIGAVVRLGATSNAVHAPPNL